MDELTTLNYWNLERRGDEYTAKDTNGFAGDTCITIQEAFESLERRLEWRNRYVAQLHTKHRRTNTNVSHPLRVGHTRLRRRKY